MTDQQAIAAALAKGGLIDMTTTGRRSGEARRIEVGMLSFDGRHYVSGRPGRRAWIANLRADPRLTVHLKRGVQADLPGQARIITEEAERRQLLGRICATWGQLDHLEAFVARAPLIEVLLDTPALSTDRTQEPQAG